MRAEPIYAASSSTEIFLYSAEHAKNIYEKSFGGQVAASDLEDRVFKLFQQEKELIDLLRQTSQDFALTITFKRGH